MEILKLIKYDFNNLENNISDAIYAREICCFIGHENKTAYGNASDYISKIPSHSHYSGHDGKVYPRYELIKINILVTKPLLEQLFEKNEENNIES